MNYIDWFSIRNIVFGNGKLILSIGIYSKLDFLESSLSVKFPFCYLIPPIQSCRTTWSEDLIS